MKRYIKKSGSYKIIELELVGKHQNIYIDAYAYLTTSSSPKTLNKDEYFPTIEGINLNRDIIFRGKSYKKGTDIIETGLWKWINIIGKRNPVSWEDFENYVFSYFN